MSFELAAPMYAAKHRKPKSKTPWYRKIHLPSNEVSLGIAIVGLVIVQVSCVVLASITPYS